MRRGILFGIFLALVGPRAFGSPAISGVSGTISTGTQITISGSNFGTGPTVLLYDGFSGGVAGNTIDVSSPEVGAWTAVAANAPKYADGGLGTGTAALMVDNVSERQFRVTFTSATEFFISYWLKIPTGGYFPETSSTETFAPGSAWKVVWLMDGASGYLGDDDICIPTWPDGAGWTLAGNDGGISGAAARVGLTSGGTNWFSFAGWNQVAAYLKGGTPDPTANAGTIWFRAMSEEHGPETFTFADRTLFDGDDNANDDATSEWTQVNVPGWGGDATAGVQVLYDAVYVATGDNARAHVELCNDIYANATQCAIVPTDSWAATSVVATIRDTPFSDGNNLKLFVVDSTGVVSDGYAVTFGSDPATPATGSVSCSGAGSVTASGSGSVTFQ